MDRKSYIIYYWSEISYFPALRTGHVLGSYFMERKYSFFYLMDRKYYSILSFNSYKKEILFVCFLWKGKLIPSYLRERESYLLLPYVQEILLLSTYGEEVKFIPTLWKGSRICSYTYSFNMHCSITISLLCIRQRGQNTDIISTIRKLIHQKLSTQLFNHNYSGKRNSNSGFIHSQYVIYVFWHERSAFQLVGVWAVDWQQH